MKSFYLEFSDYNFVGSGVNICITRFIGITKGNEGGHLAHLGGALFGFLWGMNLGKGNDLASFFQPVQDFFKKKLVKKSPLKVAHKQRLSDEEWNLTKKRSKLELMKYWIKFHVQGY